MIYRDENHYPVDQNKDGGDSAVRAGIYTMCIGDKYEILSDYYSAGKLVRHPRQVPWNSPNNFSRDQLICFLAGLKKVGWQITAERLFYSHLKRFFFAQNFERDHVGTTKYPWPHRVEGKWRYFDFADPLFPNHIGCLILAGRVFWAYPFLCICYPWHILSTIYNSIGTHHEKNQQIAESYIYGTLRFFRLVDRNWVKTSFNYWNKRNEVEYHGMLLHLVGDA